MGVKGKIEIIFGDEGGELIIDATGSEQEVMEGFENATAALLKEFMRPDKLDESALAFCNNVRKLLKRESEQDD